MDDFPPRPATPQVLLHRLPDKPDASQENARKPSKYIVVIMGSTAAAGKVQIATSVAQALGCPLFQGDSLHESSAKAASVGVAAGMKRNEQRYRRSRQLRNLFFLHLPFATAPQEQRLVSCP